MPEETPHIYIFTAGNAAAREHLETTIKESLPLERVLGLFENGTHDQIRAFDAEHGLYAWGAVPGQQNSNRWQSLKPGDWMLCVFDNHYQYVTRVLDKYDNKRFALDIWGTDPSGNTWQLMYFLTKPVKVSVPVASLSGDLNSRYMGFFKIGDEKISSIIRRFGSIDNFIETAIIKGELKPQQETPYFLIRSNEGSDWIDEVGKIYRYGSTVPNHKKLLNGAVVVVDSRINGEVRLTGYGRLDKATETGSYQRETRSGTDYEAKFLEWHAFDEPLSIGSVVLEKIRGLSGYNVQHAIRPITKEIYEELANQSKLTAKDESYMKRLVSYCFNYISAKGFNFEWEDIANVFLCIKTKPFVILAGISGTGKSKLVQLIGDAVGAEVVLIPVKPDWSDNTDLIGYEDFQQQFRPARLTETLVRAHANPTTPFFILLDEMNLARVEHYFSDFLSVMETRDWSDNGTIVTKPILEKGAHKVAPGSIQKQLEECMKKGLTIPENLYIFGTVNMDETTHPFSRKVLDRANSIEFNEIDLAFTQLEKETETVEKKFENDNFKSPYLTLKDVYSENPQFFDEIINELKEMNMVLESRGFHVGYRLRDEVCFYLYLNETYGLLPRATAMDYQIHQKILPRVYGGDEARLVLDDLRKLCDGKYERSTRKITFMLGRLDHGFTSFWL